MHPSLKPARLLFYFLSAICLFFAGLYFAGFTGQAEGQGLAGGAIVLFYGIVSGGIGFFASILFGRQFSIQYLKKINLLLGVILILFLAMAGYLILQKKDKRESGKAPVPTSVPVPLFVKDIASTEVTGQAGIGFFKPHFFELDKLFFYNRPDFNHSILEQTPQDSITFELTENGGFQISTAPPWLSPVHYKPDYELLLFSVLGMSNDFLAVVVNEEDGLVRYIDRKSGEFITWSDFLLQVNSIEPLQPENPSLKVKPLDHSSDMNEEFDFLKPLLVQGDWVYCTLLRDDLTENGKAWLRWKNHHQVLITYSIFM
jgi:hypothetical protein